MLRVSVFIESRLLVPLKARSPIITTMVILAWFLSFIHSVSAAEERFIRKRKLQTHICWD